MFFTNSLVYSPPQFAKLQQKRREIRVDNSLFSSSVNFIFSFSPNRKETSASPSFAPNSGLLKFSLQNWCHLLISGAFVLSSLHVNDIAYAIEKSKAISKYPCEEVGTYYKDLEGLEGVDLAKRLNSIVSPHHSISYKEVWEAIKILDAADFKHPETSHEVIEIYSQRVVSKQLAGKPEGWNREHLWPRSYGLQKGSARTDLHNIRPADVNVNSARGNKYYGECNTTSTRCLRPATREAASDTESDHHKWAPPTQVRGDIARSLMYMAICYGFNESDGTPYLQLSNSPSLGRHEMGLLSSLLKWNELDPPSKSEKIRNERVCSKFQHNRNPFIDHPEFVNLIWGSFSQTNSNLSPSLSNETTIEFQNNNGLNSEK
ncbi:uncharacterized protein LOC144560598 [Carex rostrata]